jgi:glycosyltransferase involved in cell wall biosynthesis
VLLTVSGRIPGSLEDDVRDGRRPRADYVEMAEAMDADIVDHNDALTADRLSRLAARIAGPDAAMALLCMRRRKSHRVVVTDGEGVGLLLASMSRLVRRRPRHVMIGHRLSPAKKVWLHRALRLHRVIDRVIVYSSAQREVAIRRLGYRPDQVILMPFMVDTSFWTADRRSPGERPRPMICAAGQELRDYASLVEAVRGLDVDVVLAAASPWSRRADRARQLDVPDNVTVTSLDLFALRQLYADSAFVVVPLEPTDFQAGITTILEAMSMGRAVICSRTEGQTDTLVDGETGVYVPPGDVPALRRAIERLLARPEEADDLGRAARRWAEDHASVERYATTFGELVRALS